MKEIKAYIKRHKLTQVTLALQKVERLTGMTVVAVRGFGRGRTKDEPQRIFDHFLSYIPFVKIEIVCHDDLVEELVSVIEENARTGLRGDGKIYVSNIEEAFKIGEGKIS